MAAKQAGGHEHHTGAVRLADEGYDDRFQHTGNEAEEAVLILTKRGNVVP
jgi:hypothetical protein